MADFGGEVGGAGARAGRRPPVIMIHGAFSGGWCFDRFRRPFEAAGHAVHAPDLPGHAAGEGEAGVRGRSIRDYAAAVSADIDACDEPPILIGHSMGGLVSELAAQHSKVAALVLLAPSPPWGQPISTPVEGAAALGLYGYGAYWLEAIRPDWPSCRSYTLDGLPEDEARAVYARMVPESGRALFEVLNWWLDPTAATLVRPFGVLAPVLGITGARDRIHSPSSVSAAVARLGGEYREAPGMSHWTVGEPGWDGVADTVLTWLAEGAAKRARVAEAFAPA